MGRNDWNDHMGGGSWWIPMMIMMIVVVGGLVWLGVTILKHGGSTAHLVSHPQQSAPVVAASPPRSTPQEILAERLARGEIEPEDYRLRLEALTSSTGN